MNKPYENTDKTIGFKSAVELASMIQDRELSSMELTRYFIERIERFDEKLNAVVVRDFDRALDSAKAADDTCSRGEKLGPLHGVPMTIKESFNITGHATTWGVPSYKENIAATDAEAVKAFKTAGAHFLGKTNVPFMLGEFQSFNEIYGVTNNPWDTTRGPGGSSGGAAAALAAGLTALEFGSDLGGSIRNPAHYCGVYSHKPTWGIIPQQGHEHPCFPPVPELVVVGPLARSAGDLAQAFDLTAGADPLNSLGWRLNIPVARPTSLRGLRIAVWPDSEFAPVDREISDRIQRLADFLASQGAVVSDKARPSINWADSLGTYLGFLNGINAWIPSASQEQTFDHGTWLKLRHQQTSLRKRWNAFFEEWDILLCPIMATTAFPHDHTPLESRTLSVNGQRQPYFMQIFWPSLATVANLPATVFPTGLSNAGLPLGLQAIGREFGDLTTIGFARLMESEWGGFVPAPGFAD